MKLQERQKPLIKGCWPDDMAVQFYEVFTNARRASIYTLLSHTGNVVHLPHFMSTGTQ